MSRLSLGSSSGYGAAASAAAAAAAASAPSIVSLPPVMVDGEVWERYPIYTSSSHAAPFHLVNFLSQLPVVQPPAGSAAAAALAASAAPAAATASASGGGGGGQTLAALPAARPSLSTSGPGASSAPPPQKLLYPFSSATRLCSPRHVDVRSKFIQRKKLMKPPGGGANVSAGAAALAATKAASAAAGGSEEKEKDGEGVNPLDRKWRLEDSRAAKGAPSYIGTHDTVPRKQIHQAGTNHFLLLRRSAEGRFTFVPTEKYAFRHVDASAPTLTLEEAEQKMKSRMKRFEKRIKSMSTLQAQNDEEDGVSSGVGGGGGGGGGLAMERARPTLTGKIQPAPREEKADDAFSDMGLGSGSSKSASAAAGAAGGSSGAALSAGARRAASFARAAKARREGGADYTRQFDDDDVDFAGEDRLDGQGAEADEDMQRDDEDEVLRAQQAEQEEANLALERANKILMTRKPGMSIEDAEDAVRDDEEADDRAADDEVDKEAAAAAGADNDEDKSSSSKSRKEAAAAAAAAAAQGSDSSDSESDFEDDELNLDDDEEDEEGDESEEDSKHQQQQQRAMTAISATPANMRKRPLSPSATMAGASPAAAAAAMKKIKVEGGAAARTSFGGAAAAGAGAAAAAAPVVSAAEIAQIEHVVVSEMLAATAPFTSKSIALHLRAKYPQLISGRTIVALRNILKTVASIQPDKNIILKKEFQTARM